MHEIMPGILVQRFHGKRGAVRAQAAAGILRRIQALQYRGVARGILPQQLGDLTGSQRVVVSRLGRLVLVPVGELRFIAFQHQG